MRAFIALFAVSAAFALLVPTAAGQIIYAVPKDERVAKRYAKNLTTFQGMKVILGEPKLGIVCSPGSISKTGGPEAKNEMWVTDPADPSAVPYEWKDGKKVSSGKRTVVAFAGDDFLGLKYVDPLQTLAGLAQEYAQRQREIETIEAERDTQEKGTVPWFGLHGKALARYDRLHSWLVNMGYPKAADKLSREIDRQKKVVSTEAAALREQKALASIKAVDPSPKFAEASEKITGGQAKFAARESQHVRMVYVTDLGDAAAERGLQLAEEIIEGFRKDFVDPYRDEEFKDYVPDKLFAEFVFVPPDDAAFEKFLIEVYGDHWGTGKNRERSLKMPGTTVIARPGYVRYWRYQGTEQTDVEGIVAHCMGHMLANLHYCRGANTQQDWLEEAVGYYVSFGHLGRNSVTCFQWNEPSYAKPAEEEGEKTVMAGLKGHFVEVALAKGPKIDQLAVKTLADMTDADFGKAWSFFDFVALKKSRAGQQWLRDTCLAASDRKNFMNRWRSYSERLFPVDKGVDVFDLIDKEWRAFAENAQAE